MGTSEQKIQGILEQALSLPEADRVELADRLYLSVDPDLGEISDDWKTEVNLRMQQIDDGTVELIPWSQARRIILADERPKIDVPRFLTRRTKP